MSSTSEYETSAEADLSGLMAGPRITVDELAVELAGIELRLRQLARAAEIPSAPVELADAIDIMRSSAASVRRLSDQLETVARIVEGDVPLARHFERGDPWGVAARGTDHQDFGGPAIVPTLWQLLHLAKRATQPRDMEGSDETTTYPEAMAGIGIWESKAAAVRRRRERDAAVAAEVLRRSCERCGAGEGELCRTSNGRSSEKPHVARLRKAEGVVDARLGALGENPVAVPDA
ncbi:zinc finger domain-containing protein [Streptomyces sp. G45]|uniref:zinc finger domain-containing protein n=1 Tax=Streptomyces sp. G45 TaxID=3406627 RepID=UPI003C20F40C